MYADAELDASVFGYARVALHHRVLDFDRAADCVDDAAKLDQRAVAGALDDAAVMHRDRRVDEIAAQGAQPRQGAVLVRACEPAEADHIDHEDRRKLPGLAHRVPPAVGTLAQKTAGICLNQFASDRSR